jgi:predicted HTH domain antitoxin
VPNSVPLSEKEMDIVRRVAEQQGMTVEEMATELVQEALKRRVRKNTGKGPARVYQLRRKE